MTWDPASSGGVTWTSPYLWSDTIDLYGSQHWAPGQLSCILYADTPTDPTLSLDNSLNNDTSFSWYSFHVNVSMSVNFTLSAAVVHTPGDWSSHMTQPVFNGSVYIGQLDFHSGTPVAISSLFDFAYKSTFSGSTSYTFTEELIPQVPEQGTVGLLALGGFCLVGRALAVRRSRKTVS